MNNYSIFKEFLTNLRVKNKAEISRRYKRITKTLNQKYYSSDSETANSLQVGSFGRKTAINGISDLDMLFILPKDIYKKFDGHQNNGQSALLQEVKETILKTYPSTKIRGDGQVVVIQFTNYVIEVCPAFKQNDGSFLYPNANDGGSWQKTNPKAEIDQINRFDTVCNGNLKRLAKIARAWRNNCGVKIGGLLIDTLCYEFFQTTNIEKSTSLSNYDILLKDFFNYLKEFETDRKLWYAPGSNQKVYKNGSNFIGKAKLAYQNIVDAISKKDNQTVYTIWRKIFGTPFPYPKNIREYSTNYTANEQYIEEFYPVDIKSRLKIECEVTQDGFRTEYLRRLKGRLKINKKLKFYIEKTDVTVPYIIKWKVKNQGEVAKRKKMLRGQILDDSGSKLRFEESNFAGAHYVECFIIKDGICIARDRIDVPIC